MGLSLEPVTNALERVRGLFQREPKAMDAFGGDDLFDGDAKPASMGPKIALAISGMLFLALAGLVTAVVMTGDDAVSTSGSLAGLEIVEEPSPDETAATDRSAERRPWLTSTQSGGRRLGVDDAGSKNQDTKGSTEAKGEAKGSDGKVGELPKSAALPTKEVKTVEAMKPPPAGQDTQAAKKPEPEKAPAPAAEPAKVAEAAPAATARPSDEAPKSPSDLLAQIKGDTAKPEPSPTPAMTPPPATSPEPAKPASATPAPATQVAAAPQPPAKSPEPKADAPEPMAKAEPEEMPSLLAPAGIAPGAPRRVESAETVTAVAGSRPQINEPRLPPTDKTSLNAPPPRFTALPEIKAEPTGATTAAKVAVVVEGLGLNRSATEAALAKLPPTVTLAFSPYARDLKRWMDRAKQKGHEVLIEVPMEGKAFPAEDPGPLGLLTSLEPKDNQDRLDTILKEASGATGIFDATGSKFRESDSHIADVFTALKQKNLFYVQGRPGIRVGEGGVPSATADVVIDERPFRAAVDARFDFAERLAKYQGSAVAIMAAKPVSFERLALWVEQLPKKGVALAPVSQVLVQ
jgi:hypothetical protein